MDEPDFRAERSVSQLLTMVMKTHSKINVVLTGSRSFPPYCVQLQS